MKARAFVQIVPERTAAGRARSLSVQRVTQRSPRDPMPGAIVVEIELDIPDEIANVQTVEAAVSAGMATIVLEPLETYDSKIDGESKH